MEVHDVLEILRWIELKITSLQSKRWKFKQDHIWHPPPQKKKKSSSDIAPDTSTQEPSPDPPTPDQTTQRNKEDNTWPNGGSLTNCSLNIVTRLLQKLISCFSCRLYTLSFLKKFGAVSGPKLKLASASVMTCDCTSATSSFCPFDFATSDPFSRNRDCFSRAWSSFKT